MFESFSYRRQLEQNFSSKHSIPGTSRAARLTLSPPARGSAAVLHSVTPVLLMELGDQWQSTSRSVASQRRGLRGVGKMYHRGVAGRPTMEESAAASVGNKEAEAGVAILVLEAAKGGIDAENLEALINESTTSAPRRRRRSQICMRSTRQN